MSRSSASDLSVVFRRPRREDAVAVARLVQTLNRFVGDPDDHFTEAAAVRDVCGAGAAVRCVVAEGRGRIVGLALWHVAYESAYAARGAFITDLVVDEGHRGRGIGEGLMAAVAAASRREQGVYLWLTTHRTNEDARRFYRRLCDVEEDGVIAYAVSGETFDRLADTAAG